MSIMSQAEAEKFFDDNVDEFKAAIEKWTRENLDNEPMIGEKGSLWSVAPGIDSLSVVSAVSLAEKKFDIQIKPEEVIVKGGYDDSGQFVEDFVPKVRAVYIERKIKEKEKEDA